VTGVTLVTLPLSLAPTEVLACLSQDPTTVAPTVATTPPPNELLLGLDSFDCPQSPIARSGVAQHRRSR